MNSYTRYIIWGSSGHAKVLVNLIDLIGGRLIALFDNNPDAKSVRAGVPLFIGKDGFSSWCSSYVDKDNTYGLAAIGGSRGRDRLAVQEYFRSNGVQIKSIIHPDASVCSTVSLGGGTQVLSGAVVASDASLGEVCIVNHSAVVDHECKLGDGVHLAPGSTLCGCVKLDDNVMIGAGAVVLPRISIGENTIVGAGAVVTRDLPPGVIVVGNPARILRTR